MTVSGLRNFHIDIEPFVLLMKYYKSPLKLFFYLYIKKHMTLDEIKEYYKNKRSKKLKKVFYSVLLT